jgi:hypothetical protein
MTRVGTTPLPPLTGIGVAALAEPRTTPTMSGMKS